MSVVIVFEGIDGSGKTTQLNLLKEELLKQNYKVCVLQNPGFNDFSRDLKELIFKYSNKITRESECLLFIANHEDIVREIEELKNSKEYDFILVDRYIYTTAAYQDCEYNYVIEDFLDRYRYLIDVIIYLESTVELKNERISQGRDEIELRDNEYYKRALTIYYDYFNEEHKAIRIDATAPIKIINYHILYELYEQKFIKE